MTEPAEKVEVSKSDLAVLQQAKALLDGLWNNTTHGNKFKKLLKESNPNLRIPEIDIAEEAQKPVVEKLTEQEKELKSLKDEMAADKKKRQEEKEENDLQKELEEVKGKYSLTPEGMEKVINRMKEKKSYDPEAAAAWVVSQMPKAKPADSGSKFGLPGKMDLYGTAKQDKDWADLHKDPLEYFDNTVRDVMDNPERFKEFGGEL
jgi:hypothetical protein